MMTKYGLRKALKGKQAAIRIKGPVRATVFITHAEAEYVREQAGGYIQVHTSDDRFLAVIHVCTP